MIKIAFFDFDGTFYSHKTHSIPKSNVLTIKKLQEKDILCVLATGRALEEIELFKDCDDVQFDGYIMNAGICVYNKNKEILWLNNFEKEDEKTLIDCFNKKEFTMCIMTEYGMYSNRIDDKITQAMNSISSQAPIEGIYQGERIYQFAGFFDQQEQEKLSKKVQQTKITRWHQYGVDITNKNVNKATTIKQYLNHFNLTVEEAICFGDGINDVEMFEECKISVCLENGIEEIKQLASYVTDDIDNDGIYKACKKLGLF